MSLSAQDVLTLAKAGFTAAQITALSGQLSTPPTVSTETVEASTEATAQAELSTEATEESTVSTEPAQSTPAPAGPSNTDIMAQLQALTAQVQRGAIRNDNQPPQAPPDSGADVLARIIDPTYKTGGK
jgi:hypothetical protein